MKPRRLNSILMTVWIIFLLVGFLPLEASARKWKAGGVANPDTLDHKTLIKWADLVKEKTNGKISIDVFPSEQLGPY